MKANRISRWVKPFMQLLIFVSILPLLTGCWDRQEIEERAIILGIGIDRAEQDNESEEPNLSHSIGSTPVTPAGLLKITLQIAVPGRIPLGPGSGTAGTDNQNTVWIVEGVGHTVNDAVNALQQRIANPLFFGHLRVIAVSEDVAKRGITNLNEFFHRNPEIRRTNWMIICKGRADALLRATPQLERVPALYMLTTLDQSTKLGRLPNVFLGKFWSASAAKGREGFLPYLILKGGGTMEVNGLAYFRDDKMVGVTEPYEITTYMGILGLNPAGGDRFVKLEGSNDYILVNSRSRKSLIKTEIRNGKPHFTISISVEANVLEKSNSSVQLNNDTITKLEQQVKQRAKKSCSELIEKTKGKGSDIFGFGERIRANYPKYWNQEIKTKENWQSMYKEITYDISVSLHIRRIGMKSN